MPEGRQTEREGACMKSTIFPFLSLKKGFDALSYRKNDERHMKKRLYQYFLSARFVECAIGVYFIVGAIPKFMDVDKFAVLMAAYKVIDSPELMQAAVLFTIFLEVSLGMLFLFGVRLKGLTTIGLQVLTIVFTILIAYAWRVNGLEDCGCFPVIKMSPPVSIVKNILILAGSVYILWKLVLFPGSKFKTAEANPEGNPIQKINRPWNPVRLLAAFVFSIVVSLACAGYAWSTFDTAALGNEESDGEGLFAQFELFMNEGYFNLADGTYLVPVLSSSCPECKEKVPDLNDLFMNPEMPPMVALCYEENPGELDEFRSEVNPVFPLYSIGARPVLYFRLIEKESFRLVLVQDGKARASWDGYVPDVELILDYLVAPY